MRLLQRIYLGVSILLCASLKGVAHPMKKSTSEKQENGSAKGGRGKGGLADSDDDDFKMTTMMHTKSSTSSKSTKGMTKTSSKKKSKKKGYKSMKGKSGGGGDYGKSMHEPVATPSSHFTKVPSASTTYPSTSSSSSDDDDDDVDDDNHHPTIIPQTLAPTLTDGLSPSPDPQICACAPSRFIFRIDFNLSCIDQEQDFITGNNTINNDGIEESSCVVEGNTNDLTPVVVSQLEFTELGQDMQQVVDSTLFESQFRNGFDFLYISSTDNPDSTLPVSSYPKVFVIQFRGRNAIGEAISLTSNFTYTNNCGAPVFETGQNIGWSTITAVIPPDASLCPTATEPNPPQQLGIEGESLFSQISPFLLFDDSLENQVPPAELAAASDTGGLMNANHRAKIGAHVLAGKASKKSKMSPKRGKKSQKMESKKMSKKQMKMGKGKGKGKGNAIFPTSQPSISPSFVEVLPDNPTISLTTTQAPTSTPHPTISPTTTQQPTSTLYPTILPTITSQPTKSRCACTPSRYEFTFNFSLTCADENVSSSDGIDSAACAVESNGNNDTVVSDMVPIRVDKVQFVEFGQNSQEAEHVVLERTFFNGFEVSYISPLSAPGQVMPINYPKIFQVTADGFNEQGQPLVMKWSLQFSNECDVFPVLTTGQRVGWTVMTALTDPDDSYCPAVEEVATVSSSVAASNGVDPSTSSTLSSSFTSTTASSSQSLSKQKMDSKTIGAIVLFGFAACSLAVLSVWYFGYHLPRQRQRTSSNDGDEKRPPPMDTVVVVIHHKQNTNVVDDADTTRWSQSEPPP